IQRPPSTEAPPSETPRLVRPADLERSQLEQIAPPTPTVTGTFAEFVCPDNGATNFKIVVNTAEGKKTFLIEDPTGVTIVGRAGGKVELNAGLQNPAPNVKVEYRESAAKGIDGHLRVLSFE